MKVFQLNGYEWWMAPTLEQAVEVAMQQTGCRREEVLDDSYAPHEVTDAEMASTMFTDDDGTKRTFAEELARRLAEPNAEPQVFAGTLD